MSVPTFFVEILPRLQVAKVTLSSKSTSTFSFTPNTISYHNEQKGDTTNTKWVQICNWSPTQLDLRSCREMKLLPGEGLSMRFEIVSENTKSGAAQSYPKCPNFVVPKDELTEYGAEQCQLRLRCGFCHTQFSLNEYTFRRVLPLPSDGWEEMRGSYFCHNHSHDGEEDDSTHLSSDAKLVPKDGDCLINSAKLLVRGSALDRNRIVIKNKVGSDAVWSFHCQRCAMSLGNVTSDKGGDASSITSMMFLIQRSKIHLDKADIPSTVNICNSWREFENYLARRLLSFSQSRVAFQFRIVDQNKTPYLTIWMLNVISRVVYSSSHCSDWKLLDKFAGLPSTAPHSQIYKDALVLKLLFQSELSSRQGDHHTTSSTDSECLELSTEECLVLVLLLVKSNLIIPPSQRTTNQIQAFKVGFLELTVVN